MDRFCLIKKKCSFWQSTIYQDFLFTILAFVSKEVCLIPKHKTNFSHVLCQKFYNFSNYIYLEKGRLPTPVFWPGEFHGLYRPWGCKELDTNEWLSLSLSITFMTMIHHEVIIVNRVWWKQNFFFFFVICVSSCSTTTYWECYTFPIEFPWHFCEKSINHMSLGQYLNLYYV